jgi:hypothetical protein
VRESLDVMKAVTILAVEWLERNYDKPYGLDYMMATGVGGGDWFYSFKGDPQDSSCFACRVGEEKAEGEHMVGADMYYGYVDCDNDDLIPDHWKAPCP